MGDGLLGLHFPAEHIIDGDAVLDIQPQAEAEAALGVQIHPQHPGPPAGQQRKQRRGGGGLAHPSLLVCDGNDGCGHMGPFLSLLRGVPLNEIEKMRKNRGTS